MSDLMRAIISHFNGTSQGSFEVHFEIDSQLPRNSNQRPRMVWLYLPDKKTAIEVPKIVVSRTGGSVISSMEGGDEILSLEFIIMGPLDAYELMEEIRKHIIYELRRQAWLREPPVPPTDVYAEEVQLAQISFSVLVG